METELTKSQLIRIRKLMRDILNYKRLYYSGNPIISDEIYDMYERRLQKLDPYNPVVWMVGYDDTYKVSSKYLPDPLTEYSRGDSIYRNGVKITIHEVGLFHLKKEN